MTNTQNEQLDTNISRLNNVTGYLGLGGIFHGGIEVHDGMHGALSICFVSWSYIAFDTWQVDGFEWSYGFCESGSGMYSCVPTKNPMYKFRQTVELGESPLSKDQVGDIALWLSPCGIISPTSVLA